MLAVYRYRIRSLVQMHIILLILGTMMMLGIHNNVRYVFGVIVLCSLRNLYITRRHHNLFKYLPFVPHKNTL